MSRLRDIWLLLNAPCRDMARLGSESLDRDLRRLEWLALRSHVLYCKSCRRYVRQLALIRTAMTRMADRIENGPGPSLPDDLRARIKRTLRDQAPPS